MQAKRYPNYARLCSILEVGFIKHEQQLSEIWQKMLCFENVNGKHENQTSRKSLGTKSIRAVSVKKVWKS